LTITLIAFIAHSVSLLTIGAQTLIGYIQTQPQVIAFFKLKTPEENIRQLENEFRLQSYVKEVSVITQSEALEIYREENQNDPLLLELVTADILPASIELKAQDLEYLKQLKEVLENNQDIEEVVYQQETINQLKSITHTVKTIGLTILVVLGLAAFLNTSVIIAMKASNQKNKIEVMRLLGASKSFVRLPFVLEGAIYVLLGSLLGWFLMFAGLMTIWPNISEKVSVFFPTASLPLMLVQQIALGSLLSLLIGGLAGLVSVGKLIKK